VQILAHACGSLQITAGKHRGYGVRHCTMSQCQGNSRTGTTGRTATHRVDHHHHGTATGLQHRVNLFGSPCFLHPQLC